MCIEYLDTNLSSRFASLRRLYETMAARQPVLKWTPPEPYSEAAE